MPTDGLRICPLQTGVCLRINSEGIAFCKIDNSDLEVVYISALTGDFFFSRQRGDAARQE